MKENLLIVESPTKVKTLNKYLGKNFSILASYGHVRDLIPKLGAVDPVHNFSMTYKVIEKNIKHIETICHSLLNVKNLYLATDPDREGEAISWHLYSLLQERGLLKEKKIYRIVFFEITKSAVQYAINNPRTLSMELVYAQQARRALDFLVGFHLSPLLWKKIRPGLSAGRVQSPALRMIVEREMEITAFKASEYWTIEANLNLHNSKNFKAKLIKYNYKKIKEYKISNKEQANEIKKNLIKQALGKLIVDKISKIQVKSNPIAPFTTSSLQQAAANKLGFTAKRTMIIAQQLYEGVDIYKDSTVSLITYIRTDSVSIANEALNEIRNFIIFKYGRENLSPQINVYKNKIKNAQEAHESIRPTYIKYIPSKLINKLSSDQYKLYNLIWNRTISCQMIHATIDKISIEFKCGSGNVFYANESYISNLGFKKVYIKDTTSNEYKLFIQLKQNDVINLQNIDSVQHFTKPSSRYSEASLIKTLEEYGIGRPSTYASIISTLQNRDYVILENRHFKPTDIGHIVNNFLINYFNRYVDYGFTAQLENSLDSIAAGKTEWLPLLKEFWSPFINLIKQIDNTIQRKDVIREKLNEKCPVCESQLSICLGKTVRFIGCNGYPDCKYTRNLNINSETNQKFNDFKNRQCPKCKSDLIIKHGKYGQFIGCSSYPKCKFIDSLLEKSFKLVDCPYCKNGSIIKRKNRYGNDFYSCNKYPDCKYILKYLPINESCPKCQWPILMHKKIKNQFNKKICPQKMCDFYESIENIDN